MELVIILVQFVILAIVWYMDIKYKDKSHEEIQRLRETVQNQKIQLEMKDRNLQTERSMLTQLLLERQRDSILEQNYQPPIVPNHSKRKVMI